MNKGFSALLLSTARGLRCCVSLSGATIRDVSFSLSQPLPHSPDACFHQIGCIHCKWEGVDQDGCRDAEEDCGNHVSRWWRGAQLPRGLSDAGGSCCQRSTCRIREGLKYYRLRTRKLQIKRLFTERHLELEQTGHSY